MSKKKTKPLSETELAKLKQDKAKRHQLDIDRLNARALSKDEEAKRLRSETPAARRFIRSALGEDHDS